MIEVPEAFAARTIAREGAAGRMWLDRLPEVVAGYLDRWALTQDGPVMHGYVGIALLVLRADREPAVLKVSWQDGDINREARALNAWNGRGAARVLERDDPAGVLLLKGLPIVALPSLNTAQARHPAWTWSVERLRECAVQVLFGPGGFEPVDPGSGNEFLPVYPWELASAALAELTS